MEFTLALEFTFSSQQRIFHIYDRIFKKILTLSSRAVIGLINGLFETDIIEAELTKKITKQVTEDVTRQVTQQVQENIICKLYSKLGNIEHVADLLGLSASDVEKAVEVAGKYEFRIVSGARMSLTSEKHLSDIRYHLLYWRFRVDVNALACWHSNIF